MFRTTRPVERCGDRVPQGGLIGFEPEIAECALRPGHSGSHADERGSRWCYTPDTVAGTRTDTAWSGQASVTADDLAHALQQAHEGWALDLSPGCAAVMAERLLERFDFHRRDGAPAATSSAEEETAELRVELSCLDATLTNLRGAHLNLQHDYHRALKDTYAVQRVRAVHQRILYRDIWICAECSGYGGGSCDNRLVPWPCTTAEALAEPRPDTGRVRGTTPPPAPATGGVLEDALAVVGETSAGCFIPPRTPAGQRARTRPDTPDSRTQDGPDTAPTRADTVRAAINRAFDIHTEATPDSALAGQDTTRTRSASTCDNPGQWDCPHMRKLVAAQHEKVLIAPGQAYAEREQLRPQVRELSEELA